MTRKSSGWRSISSIFKLYGQLFWLKRDSDYNVDWKKGIRIVSEVVEWKLAFFVDVNMSFMCSAGTGVGDVTTTRVKTVTTSTLGSSVYLDVKLDIIR